MSCHFYRLAIITPISQIEKQRFRMIKLQTLASLPPIVTPPPKTFLHHHNLAHYSIRSFLINQKSCAHIGARYAPLYAGHQHSLGTYIVQPQPTLLPLSSYPSPQFWWKLSDPPEVILAPRTSSRLFIHEMPLPLFLYLSWQSPTGLPLLVIVTISKSPNPVEALSCTTRHACYQNFR